eukprot:CAMPEP_0174712392 /NCGR_PEP_ID=MMETSP1094-20130205/13404_1 /TAXON_ID=156173 /ORGANISM="Chrysochromulina brevifilum, Strain UTEX LB 985" /LENGTH=63 /DNA_ID=CAMNT_0015911457 /DNA_START=141 /DNA_END=332 /DNA_ORIENTATION=-
MARLPAGGSQKLQLGSGQSSLLRALPGAHGEAASETKRTALSESVGHGFATAGAHVTSEAHVE